jgi:hypothetical protein
MNIRQDVGRPLGVRTGKHKNNLKQSFVKKSKFIQHVQVYEEGVIAECGRKLWYAIEHSIICRKYKEFAHMSCVTNYVSQPSVEISPVWISHV